MKEAAKFLSENLDLIKYLQKSAPVRAGGQVRSLPAMVRPLGGKAESYSPGSTFQGHVSKIQARGKGALSEIVSAKATEKNVSGDRTPSVHHGEIFPPDGGADVAKGGNGTTRPAEPEAKVALARELLKAALMAPAQSSNAAMVAPRVGPPPSSPFAR